MACLPVRYRRAAELDEPLAKLRVVAAEGRQNPKVGQIWDELFAKAARTRQDDGSAIKEWTQKLYRTSHRVCVVTR